MLICSASLLQAPLPVRSCVRAPRPFAPAVAAPEREVAVAEQPAVEAPSEPVPVGGDPWEDAKWTQYKVWMYRSHSSSSATDIAGSAAGAALQMQGAPANHYVHTLRCNDLYRCWLALLRTTASTPALACGLVTTLTHMRTHPCASRAVCWLLPLVKLSSPLCICMMHAAPAVDRVPRRRIRPHQLHRQAPCRKLAHPAGHRPRLHCAV